MSFFQSALLLFGIVALSGCGQNHRITRPEISGFVYDAQSGNPLVRCQVGEVVTDELGYFNLPAEFSPVDSAQEDDPLPLLVSEFVVNPGYEMVRLFSVKPWGVPIFNGHWEAKPIYLRKTGQLESNATNIHWRDFSDFVPIRPAVKRSDGLPQN